MSPRPKAKTTPSYVDIIPAELRAQFHNLASKHTALVMKSGSLSADDWAELAEIEDSQADLLVQLHRLFYDHDQLVSDVMNSAHVDARHDARNSRKNAAVLRGEG